jgi:hypothetical protein
MYVDVPMYNFNYVIGIIPFLTPSCLYAELVLILIKTSQSELFLRMMGGVFV